MTNLTFDFEQNSKKLQNLEVNENYSCAQIGKLNEIQDYVMENKDLNLKVPSKLFLKKALNLSGAEISFAKLPKNTLYISNHKHKENEEIYIILSGSGVIKIDDKEIELKEGSIAKVAPDATRAIKCDEDMTYICIQVKQNSLENYTLSDAIML